MREINTQSDKKKDKKIDIISLLRFYSTKWKYILVSVIVFMILGGIYAYTKSPIYEVQANVLITDNDTKNDFLRNFSMADMFGGKAAVDDEIALMYSHTLFNNIVREYQLNEQYIVKKNLLKKVRKYDDSPIELIIPQEFSDTLTEPVIFKLNVSKNGKVDVKMKKDRFSTIAETKDKTFPVRFKTSYGEFVFNTTKYYEEGESLNMTVLVTNYNAATESLQKNVMCAIPNKKARVITVSLNSTSIPFAEKIVNAVVDGYNQRGIHENRVRNQITADFVEKRLTDLTEELNSTERTVENYKKDNNIVDLTADAQYIFTKKGTIDQELVKAETEYEILEMTRELMNDPSHKYDLIPTPYGAEAAVEAITEYNKLVLERMKLINNAKTNNNAALRTISGQLDAMRDNINATLDRSLASARVKLHDLREQMNESDSRLGELPRQEREYLNIKRRQMVQENIYLLLLKQLEETNLRIANAIPKGQVIDRAYPLEGQANLTKVQIMILFFILGLIAVPVWLYVRDLFRNKISSRKEVADSVSFPIIGSISKNKSNDKRVSFDYSNETAETFRQLRTNMQFLMAGADNKTIQITSMSSGSGKTFVAANLAASIAQTGKKVVLVDMDIRNPQIAEFFDMPESVGISQYLIDDNVTINDLVQKVKSESNLSIVAGGIIPPNPSELLMSKRVDMLFEELRRRFDIIVVDSSPLGQISDSASLNRVADITLIVCRINHTTFAQMNSLGELSLISPLKRIGLIINGVKPSQIYPH